MRYQIVKETFANEDFRFHIRYKKFIFWSTVENHYEETEYFKTLDEAMEKLKSLLDYQLANLVMDVQVVYDTGE